MGTSKFKVAALPARLSRKQRSAFLPACLFQLRWSSWVVESSVWMSCMLQVQLYSEPNFQGRLLDLEDSAATLDEDFITKSCKVLAGR